MGIEENFPLEQLIPLAIDESQSKQNYRPVYSIHHWWARRLGSVFRTIGLSLFVNSNNPKDIWDKYYSKNAFNNKIILDPFMGGGTTVVEINRLGARCVGQDINPVAWLVVKKELEKVNITQLEKTYGSFREKVKENIARYYKTKCIHCGHQGDVIHFFWVKSTKCIGCGDKIKLFDSFKIAGAKSNSPSVFLCPRCNEIFSKNTMEDTIQCPQCKEESNWKVGPYQSGKGKYICTCGQKYEVISAFERNANTHDLHLYCILYYCNRCKTKSYKKPDSADYDLYDEVSKTVSLTKNKLSIPTQVIPFGYNTRIGNDLVRHGYKYFSDMFNARQLFSLSTMINEISKIDDKNIIEFILLSFSEALDFNNQFCQYMRSERRIGHLFAHHAFIPRMQPVENNPLAVHKKITEGTIDATFSKLLSSKKYCESPFEKIKNKAGKITNIQILNEKIEGNFANNFEDLFSTNGNVLIKCGTSEVLNYPDKSFDAIITDPPYFDNVMYGELSDFYYIWLRLLLKDRYDEFKPELAPKSREVVKNDHVDKDDEFFGKGLTTIFQECYRVLKDDGYMIFTYHHGDTNAWSIVLNAVLKSQFYIVAIYPVQGESGYSTHIKDLNSIEYDAIIVCRKRTEEKRTTFERYEEELYLNAKKIIENERKKRSGLSKGDISVIVFGKCLEIYSKYYPNITQNGVPVSVETATDKVWEIIEQLSETDYLPPDIDPISRAVTLNLFGSSGVSYDELNKRLRQRGIDVSEFEAEKLISGPKNAKVPTDPFIRKSHIEEKLNKGEELLDIDKAQYLYILYTTDKNPSMWLNKWKTPKLEHLCKILAEKTGDQRYADVMKITLDMF